MVDRGREREWRSALLGARTLLKYHPPWKSRGHLPVSRVHFGSLRRLRPINLDSGFGSGQPIERYYIEKVLARLICDVQGRVVENGDDSYHLKVWRWLCHR